VSGVSYREYLPCGPLREHVRAFFTFTPPGEGNAERRTIIREVRLGAEDPFASPLIADGHVSLAVSLGRAYRADGSWHVDPAGVRAEVIGAMSQVREVSLAERAEMVGVYFRAGQVSLLTSTAAGELTDRIVKLDELWGASGWALAEDLAEQKRDADRLELLETFLIERMERSGGAKRRISACALPALTESVLQCRGRTTVEHLATAAGVSRQHLAREFRENVGVAPKLYCRLARFRATLAYAGRGGRADWAEVAAEMGYADQSHLIAEFREFSSLTPESFTRGRYFHPLLQRRFGADSIFPISPRRS